MKKILLFIFIICILFLVSSRTISAADDSTASADVKKYKITFPIEELGNCEDLSSCKSYCADPANNDACVAYAKKKGFYKQPQINKILKTAAIKAYAKNKLGCDSENSCKEACSKTENIDKCKAFAQTFDLKPKNENITNQLLIKAKEILGCESGDSCKGICQKPENFEKCSEFAKLVGLSGGVKRAGPGGCDSEDSCKAFCSDPQNYETCADFNGPKTKFKGPGGCTSKESCLQFCSANPQYCQKFEQSKRKTASTSGQIISNYEKLCRENPQKCSQILNDQSDKYCKERPEQCSVPQRLAVEEKIKYCKEHPQNCEQDLQTITSEASRTAETPKPTPAQLGDSVKGVSISGNIIQRILNFLFR